MKKLSLKNASSSTKKTWFAFILLIPFILGFLLFFIRPLCLSFYYSLNKVEMNNYVFKGIGNYKTALLDQTEFTTNLLGSLEQLLLNVPLIMFFSLFVATLLSKEFKGRNFTRVILFLPVIISTGALLQVENLDFLMGQGQQLLADAGGSGVEEEAATFATSMGLKDLLLSLNMPTALTDYMSKIIGGFYTVLTSSGVQITLLIAAWQSIPPSLYEASAMEGATAWEDFWKITIPMISPYIFVCTIYSIVDTFTSQNNGIVSYILNVGKGTQNDYGLSSAMAWIYFLMVAIILGLVAFLFLRGKLVVYQER